MSEKKGFTLTCDCGCSSGMEFHYLDNIYISFFNSLFYSKQETMKTRISDRLKELKNGGLLFDIVVTRQDLIDLAKWLKDIECSYDNVDNMGKIEFEYDSKYGFYNIYLKCDKSFGKLHRAYEFEINEFKRQELLYNLYKLILSKEDYKFII